MVRKMRANPALNAPPSVAGRCTIKPRSAEQLFVKPRRMQVVRIAISLVGVIAAMPASASGGTGEYRLGWPVKGEILAYHSCGCADACWVAEVRDSRTKTMKSRLRCDCERLHFLRPGLVDEHVISNSCDDINNSDDKPAAIRRKLSDLYRR